MIRVARPRSPLLPPNPLKEVEQAKAIEKEKNTSKGVVPETTKPPAAPKDLSKGRETPQHLKIVLATLPMPTKEDAKGKGPTSTVVETTKSTKATRKENPSLKIN